MTLSDDKSQSCEAVDGIAQTHLAEIDRKIGDLTALRLELSRVIGSCSHGTVADCKIIETMGPQRLAQWRAYTVDGPEPNAMTL